MKKTSLLSPLRRLRWLDLSSPAVTVCAMSCKDGMWQEGDGAQAGPCWLLTLWSLLAACYGVLGSNGPGRDVVSCC